MKKKIILIIFIATCINCIIGCKKTQDSSFSLKNKAKIGETVDKVTVSESAVLSITNSLDQASSEKIEKTKSDESMVPEKTETIQDMTYQLQYLETEERTGIRVHDRDVYVDENGIKVKYDNETGQMVGFAAQINNNDVQQPITEEEALQIAQNFMNMHMDLTQYTFMDIFYDEYTGFEVRYTKKICGYNTTDLAVTSVSKDGKVQWFAYNPYIFDGKQIETIDEKKALNSLDKKIKVQYQNTLIQYTVIDKQLSVESEKIVLQFLVEVHYKQKEEIVEQIVYSINI